MEQPEYITGDWQVTVEVYKNYVLKTPKSIQQIEIQIRKAEWTKDFSDKKIHTLALESLIKHKQSVQSIFNSGIPLDIFANPILLDYEIIKQDRVVIISELVEQKELERKTIIDIVNAYSKLWQYGIFDTSWNFTLNNGIDKQGNIVFVDIGECATSYKELEKMITENRWKNSFSFKALSTELQEVFTASAKESLTTKNLQKNWKIKYEE